MGIFSFFKNTSKSFIANSVLIRASRELAEEEDLVNALWGGSVVYGRLPNKVKNNEKRAITFDTEEEFYRWLKQRN